MFITKIETVDRTVIDKIICNRCGSEIERKSCGWEFATLMADWGYDSQRDGQHHEAHLCESCYDEVIVDFKQSPLSESE